MSKYRGKNTFPTAIKRAGYWFRYDRYTKQGEKGKANLKKIGDYDKRTGAIKGYRIRKANWIPRCYGLYIRT